MDRIVQHMAVAIQALRVERCLDERVRRDEAADHRVIHAAVHVDQAEIVQLLVLGVAASRGVADRCEVCGRRRTAPCRAVAVRRTA